MAVAATGFFDGVHLGHRAVTETLLRTARERGEQSLVVTFWPHPRVVLGKDPRELRLLSSLDEKIALLRSLGADRVEVVPFTREFASMSAREYLEMLRRDYEVTAIVLGYDNRFGSDALSTEQIAALANEMGVQVQIVSQCTAVLQKGEDSPQENCATLGTIRGGTVSEANGGVERSETFCRGGSSSETISSTKIRKALAAGKVDAANAMLGYEYSLGGVVVGGNRMGRTIGFPTANMKLREPLKCLPAAGVYLSRVTVEGRQLRGMTNIDPAGKIETHIFDFSDEIYGQDITVTFVERIRDEIRFGSFDALKAQLLRDREVALGKLAQKCLNFPKSQKIR